VGHKDQRLLVLAATNVPWDIDLALRRAGRFSSVVFVPPPDSVAREEMFRLLLKGKPQKDILIGELVKLSDGFSGAELKEVVLSAADSVLKVFVKSQKLRPLSQGDLLSAVARIRPTAKKWFADAKKKLSSAVEDPLFEEINAVLV